ncbi:MAG: HAMP domain-containing histidine kinase, partial [Nocardiopsaceae bacterium]|nr:HAMP domain-containing histidine kinase [Nocardiopsaceae bacterium]
MKSLRALADRTPLRTKLIAAVLALVILALAAISVTTVAVLRSSLTKQYDDTLKQVFATASADPQAAFFGRSPGYAYQLPYANGIAGIQLTGNPLRSLSRSGIGNRIFQQATPLPSVPTSRSWASANNGDLLTLGSQSGPDLWRVMTEPYNYDGQSATLVVAFNLGNVNAEIRQLVTVVLIVGAAIVIVLAAAGVGVVQANLRPLNDIEMTAGQIAKGHLNHRIPERDPRTEIGSLGRSLNAMLAQIEAAFRAQENSERAAHESEERMRQFIADASHELRTPLTTIRGFAEYYRQRGGLTTTTPSSRTDNGDSPAPAGSPAPGEPEGATTGTGGLDRADIDRIMQRLESEGARMGLLVEDLLQLARLDQQRPLNLVPVDLLTLAADAVQDARMVAPDRSVDLIVGRGTAFIVDGDEQRLRQVIGNLIGNALTHTPSGTPVRVRIGSGTLNRDGSAGDADSGTGIPAVVLD